MKEPENYSVYTKEDDQNCEEAILAAQNGITIKEIESISAKKSRNLVVVLQGYFHSMESVEEWANHLY